METNLSGEPAGTVLLGSIEKRCYLFLCQTAERMKIERANARQHGIQDPIDFVFELEGKRFELSYKELLRRLDSIPCSCPLGSCYGHAEKFSVICKHPHLRAVSA